MKHQDFPSLPPLAPQRGTPLSRKLWRNAFLAHGWEIRGEIPNIAKAMLIGAPHTSNYDAWFAMMGILGLGLNMTVMAKDNIFKPPFKGFLRWLNVRPVKRSSPQGLIEQIQDEFNHHESVWIGIAPEGTRAGAQKWKSGFYRIAIGAHVPIIMVGFDYAKKQIIFLGTFYPTGNYEQDLATIIDHYQGLMPFHPEKLSQPLKQP